MKDEESLAQDEKYTVYPAESAAGDLAIFLPGLTQGCKSEFSRYIIDRIVSNLNITAMTFDFNFFKSSIKPSVDLREEVAQLADAVIFAQEKMAAKRVVLVGKSFGGIVAAAFVAESATRFPGIVSLSILGWPLVLGFPPRVELLGDGASMEPAYDYQGEYRRLIQDISGPLHIIQGSEDNLGPLAECLEVTKDMPNITFKVIDGGNHSFDGKNDLCADAMVEGIKGSLR